MLKDIADLDVRMADPTKYDEIQKEKYKEYKSQAISRLSTQSETLLGSQFLSC